MCTFTCDCCALASLLGKHTFHVSVSCVTGGGPVLDSPEEPPDELLANVQEKRVPLQIANAPPQQVGPLCLRI
jgi:hypothetical protein